jgi:hypothetical protein
MTGRNDPCHCGSGQKYKKCCLYKDKEAERKARAALSAPPPIVSEDAPPGVEPNAALLADFKQETAAKLEEDKESEPAPIDPLQERMNAFWGAFEAAGYDQRWTLLTGMLTDEPELCDGEMLFETANMLFQPAVQAGEGGRFLQLLDQFATAVPEAYEAELAYILQWRMTLALIAQDQEELRRAFLPFSQVAGEYLDQYYKAIEGLAYHGAFDLLLEGMRLARPLVAEADGLVPWAGEEFDKWLVKYELLEMTETNPALTAADAELNERLAAYGVTIDAAGMDDRLNYLTGRQLPNWTAADFAKLTYTKREKNYPRDELFRLLDAFLHYAHFEEGVSWPKTQMAYDNLLDYLIERAAGELAPEQPRRGKRKGKKPEFQSNLAPDHGTLDRFLVRFAGIFSFHFYQASAFFELIPVWLRFLVKYGLLEEAAMQQTIRSLSALHGSLLSIAQKQIDDPLPAQNLAKWG